ncbi:MAG: alpha-E domain-containing protein [Ktedonobacteraceae bacterium]
MLSRVADSLYWMSRYLERAEHTARLIDVNLNQMLESAQYADLRWERLSRSLRVPMLEGGADEAYRVTQSLTFDTANSASIISCLASARENARQVREQISSEMWEQLNRLYLQVKRTGIEEIWHAQPHMFLAGVKEGIQLFQGVTDATMNHSEGWHFIRVGCYTERASQTATLLDVHFHALMEIQEPFTSASLDYMSWVGLLRSCAAFEAYCKVYTANIQPSRIAEFLLFNAESPRSLRFAATMMQNALQSITKITTVRNAGRVERLAGRLRASLDYDQIDEIIGGSMHSYLENIQLQCRQINEAVYQVYITYPIDVALTA